jgi:photosystem II stability/assembly factor-like uncharacterized protein
MKFLINILFTFLFLVIQHNTSYCQWTSISSGTDNHLFCVHFPSDNIGYVVGTSATVLKSIDGGNTWNPLNTGLSWELFESVYFLNDTVGFVTGATNGKILKTINGGSSWTTMTLPTTNDLNDIKFVNDTVGLAVGYREIWKTTDQGKTWSSQYANQNLAFPVFFSVEFQNADTVFIAGVDGETGRILKTTNGGDEWSSTSISPQMRFDVKFPSKLIGYTTGTNSDIYKTIDGGANWSLISDPEISNNKKMSFLSENIGYAAGYNGHILGTIDGGLNWSTEETGIDDDLNWIHFVTETLGFAVGDTGTILKFSTQIPTAVNEKDRMPDIEVFPNPSADNLNIEINSVGEEVVEITLLNSVGILVYNEKLHNRDGQILKNLNVLNLSAGQYLLSVRTDNKKRVSKKLLIVK